MHFSDVEVGKQLIVGEGTYYDCLGLGRKAIRGSAYIEGPFLLGDARSFSEKVLATAMIARDKNTDASRAGYSLPPRSLWVKGNTRLEGDDGTPNALNITGNTKQVGDVVRTGDETATGKITASSTVKASNFVGETIPIINEETGLMIGVVSEANIFDAYLTTQSQVHDLEHN